MLGAVVVAATPLVLALIFERVAWRRLEGSPWLLPVQTTSWAVLLVVILVFARDGAADFIYFQF
jgi:hypothetical protein